MNHLFIRIGAIAYNLFIGFKRLTCPESWLRETIAILRYKMIQVAGRIFRHAGKVILKIATGIDKLNIFKGIRGKICKMIFVLTDKDNETDAGRTGVEVEQGRCVI